METFVFILIIFACVVASAVLDQLISRVSLPLIQIAIGVVVAAILPSTSEAQLDSELFLVMFIAPLLFDEARHANPRTLWANKGSILSLAIGLVVATVLVVGFALHAIVPSIPLAAAFACAAALGPTDAAAVAALGQTVSLSPRQRTLLSGEALINDASGVVSFQFAIAAVLTGTFSALDAGVTFARLFFGGILAGVVLGALLRAGIRTVRSHGLESTTIHVLYEVISPFFVFLTAEALGVSGILAVVAAGLVMAEPAPRLTSISVTRHRMVSTGVWEVLIFLINGILFVMLGMQLPHAINPAIMGQRLPLHLLVGYVLALTALVIGVRLLWTTVMEFAARDPKTGRRGVFTPLAALRRAATLTVAGPKGAVTLSIIFTLPYFSHGEPFPDRALIIFLTAGVILCTLLLADALLPVLAPAETPEGGRGMSLRDARAAMLRDVIHELQLKIEEHTRPEFEPATRAVIGQYRKRLINNTRQDISREMTDRLSLDIIERQQSFLDDAARDRTYDAETIARSRAVLDRRRKLLGADIGGGPLSRLVGAVRRQGLRLRRTWQARRGRQRLDPDATLAMTPVQVRKVGELSTKLERIAIEYLKERVAEALPEERRAAVVLLDEHRLALAAAKARAAGEEYDEDPGKTAGGTPLTPSQEQRNSRIRYAYATSMSRLLSIDVSRLTPQQIELMSEHLGEVESGALRIELDKIRQMHEAGKISQRVARTMREDVYLLQMGVSDS